MGEDKLPQTAGHAPVATSTLTHEVGPPIQPIQPPVYDYRGVSHTAQPPTCLITLDDLRRLYSELDRKTQEAVERFLATLPLPPDRSAAEFAALKQQARDVGHVTLAVRGAGGEEILSRSLQALESNHLPERITLVSFDSAVALQLYNVRLPNRFLLRLDFAQPSGVVRYDPWSEPTPNGSKLEVSGIDETWVTAVYETTLAFFGRRKKRRRWLHSDVSFTLLNWCVGIPASLWMVYRLDSLLLRWAPSIHGALRGAADVYLFLTSMLAFRVMVYGLRWMFPLIELEGAVSKNVRRSIGGVIATLLLALLYDILKAILS